MARSAIAASLAIVSLGCINGCGSLLYCPGPSHKAPQAYGGVALSTKFASDCAKQAVKCENAGDCFAGCVGAVYFAVIDTPLSAVADTIALPFSRSSRKAEKTVSGVQPTVGASSDQQIVRTEPPGLGNTAELPGGGFIQKK